MTTIPKHRPTLSTTTGSAHARIWGVGGYRPERVVTNDEICEHIDSSDQWIRERTGIITRRRAAPAETVVDMGSAAALDAINSAGLTVSQIDVIILATVTHPYQTPGAAPMVAGLHPARVALVPYVATAQAHETAVPHLQLDPVGVPAVDGVRRVPPHTLRYEFHRRRAVGIGRPLAQVARVRAPLQDAAAVEIEVPPPAPRDILRVVRPPRGRPQPAVPIAHLLGWLGLAGQPVVNRGRRPAVARTHLRVDSLQLAEFAAARQVEGLDEIRPVAPLRPRLVNPSQPQERVRQRAAVGDGHGARLLAVNVLARLRRHHREQRMPAVARGDQQGVDILARPQLLLVGVHRAIVVAVFLVHHGLDGFTAFIAHVADRHELHVRLTQEAAQIAGAAAADAEAAHADAVAGRYGPVPPQCRRGHNQRRRRQCPGPERCPQRLPSRQALSIRRHRRSPSGSPSLYRFKA